LAGIVLPILLLLNSRGGRQMREPANIAVNLPVKGARHHGLCLGEDAFPTDDWSAGVAPGPRGHLTSAHLFGLIFLWCAAISISWSAQVYDGLDELIKLIIIAEAFWLGSKLTDLKPVIIGFGLGIWVSSLVILFGIDAPHTTDNAGLFVNSNVMGEIAGLVLVAALFYRAKGEPRSISPL